MITIFRKKKHYYQWYIVKSFFFSVWVQSTYLYCLFPTAWAEMSVISWNEYHIWNAKYIFIFCYRLHRKSVQLLFLSRLCSRFLKLKKSQRFHVRNDFVSHNLSTFNLAQVSIYSNAPKTVGKTLLRNTIQVCVLKKMGWLRQSVQWNDFSLPYLLLTWLSNSMEEDIESSF